MKGSIVKPEFTSQIKSTIDDPIKKFETYVFRKSDWTPLWKLLEEHIMSMFLQKNKDKKSRVTRGRINVPKCDDAKFAGTKEGSAKCSLIICEGDSAMGTMDSGLLDKSNNLSYDYYGTFSIQGVPMNARKAVNIFEDKQKKTTEVIRNKQLTNNEAI